jgi:hypothetical protein
VSGSVTEPGWPDGSRDDDLHEILLARGWRSDRADLPDEGDSFEWPPSISLAEPPPKSMEAADESGSFGTTIYVEASGYAVYGPQTSDAPVQPRVRYQTRGELLRDIGDIESWR